MDRIPRPRRLQPSDLKTRKARARRRAAQSERPELEAPSGFIYFIEARVGDSPELIQSPRKLLGLAVAVPLPSAPLCRASRSACRSGLIETPPVATGSTPLFGDFP